MRTGFCRSRLLKNHRLLTRAVFLPNRFLVTLAIGAILLAGQQPQKSEPQTPHSDVLTLPSGGTLRYVTQSGGTLVEIRPPRGGGAKTQVLLKRDETVSPASRVQSFELLGEKPGGVYVISDGYASRPGPMSYCQAGKEQFARVLARRDGSKADLRETFSLKVASCRSNLELGPAGLSWDGDTSTLLVDEERLKRYRVGEDGLVTPY